VVNFGRRFHPEPGQNCTPVHSRWFERSEDGAETNWGRVLDWKPPGRVLLAWQLDSAFKYDPQFETEVEVTLAAEGDGTRVVLQHRNIERFGEGTEKFGASLDQGWSRFLKLFAEYAETSR
jgi:uncharacterized protein YndB with AHSA1/START domain